MSQEPVVDIIEDRRQYKALLREILKHLRDDTMPREMHAGIEGLLNRTSKPDPGPWPILTDHIARCGECKSLKQYAPAGYTYAGVGENEIVFKLCEEGKNLWKKFVDHRDAARESADKKALQ